ncbi:MAG TPA: hypothetical protein VGK74_11200 [Symbiobacteriaceae bacterium]
MDRRLRISDYTGRAVSAPELPGNPVQQVVWSPRGDFIVATTGKPAVECCELYLEAQYWLVPVPQGPAQELTGLPQEVVFTWSADEQSLYVLDNWRRRASLDALGERIQRYDLSAGRLTLLLDRHERLSSVAELPGGDLLVGQYAGGGHMFYYRLPAGSDKLVTAAPFHMSLSPDQRWAMAGNFNSLGWLDIANVQTGEVTRYQPHPPWPAIDLTPPPEGSPLPRITDPEWGPDSRWLMYSFYGTGLTPVELRFFDRTQAEPDRVVPGARGAWLPGPGLQALVFRHADDTVQPWRYDVAAGKLIGPVGPQAPAAGKPRYCQPLRDIRVAADAGTAAYITCDNETHTLWFIDLTARVSPLVLPVEPNTWLLSLSADGQTAALKVDTGDGWTLRLVHLPRK